MKAPTLITAGALLTPGVAQAQSIAAAPAFELPLLRLAVGLILCSMLALAAALLLKRWMQNGRLTFGARTNRTSHRRRITVFETQRLSLHGDVCRFAYDGAEYVVVVSENGATLICTRRLEEAPEPAS